MFSSNISNTEDCLGPHFTEKKVENKTHSGGFLTNLEVLSVLYIFSTETKTRENEEIKS